MIFKSICTEKLLGHCNLNNICNIKVIETFRTGLKYLDPNFYFVTVFFSVQFSLFWFISCLLLYIYIFIRYILHIFQYMHTFHITKTKHF